MTVSLIMYIYLPDSLKWSPVIHWASYKSDSAQDARSRAWGVNGRQALEGMPVTLSESSCQLFPTAGRVDAADSVHQMGQDSADVRWGGLQTEQNLTSIKTCTKLLFSGFRGTTMRPCLPHPLTTVIMVRRQKFCFALPIEKKLYHHYIILKPAEE